MNAGEAPVDKLEMSKVGVFTLGVRTELGSFKSLKVSEPVFTSVVVSLNVSTSLTDGGAISKI